MEDSSLSIGILGTGNIGHNAAIHFVKAGHDVYLANSRGPESLGGMVAELGPRAHAGSVAEAVAKAGIVLLSLPWQAKEATIRAAGGPAAFAEKLVIDAMNPYTEYPAVEDLGGRASSEVVAAFLDPSAKVVKAFNTIYYESLANDARKGAPLEDRIAIPIAGDDVKAKRQVAALIEAIGFAPVDTGILASSHAQEPEEPLYNRNFKLPEFRAELARIRR